MRILLIDPPYGPEEAGGKKQNFKDVLNCIPSLGLAYIAASAERAGHRLKVIDAYFSAGNRGLAEAAKEFRPEIIGLTATTPAFSIAVRIASFLREILPEVIFVCGGAHPTVCPVDSLSSGVFDFLILGEGEETFLELVSYIEAGRSSAPEHIPGVAFRRDGRTVVTERRARIKKLDALPFPARHLLPPLAAYRPTPASYRRLPLAVIMASRGCPGSCTFCDRSVFGQEFRQRSAANVMAEVEEVISRYRAREIRFFDDTFTLNRDFLEDICAGMQKLRPRIPWTCLTRVTAVDPGMLRSMRRAGCWQILFGLESADEHILRRLGKGNTVEQNRQAVFWAKEAGLSVRADFLVGSPWETKETFRKTVEFAKNLPLDFAHFNKFVPLPGTGIYADLIAGGHKISFDKGASINDQTDSVYIPESFTKQEYIGFLNQAYRDFYLRPGYILHKLLSVRTVTELVGHFKGLRSIISL